MQDGITAVVVALKDGRRAGRGRDIGQGVAGRHQSDAVIGGRAGGIHIEIATEAVGAGQGQSSQPRLGQGGAAADLIGNGQRRIGINCERAVASNVEANFAVGEGDVGLSFQSAAVQRDGLTGIGGRNRAESLVAADLQVAGTDLNAAGEIVRGSDGPGAAIDIQGAGAQGNRAGDGTCAAAAAIQGQGDIGATNPRRISQVQSGTGIHVNLGAIRAKRDRATQGGGAVGLVERALPAACSVQHQRFRIGQRGDKGKLAAVIDGCSRGRRTQGGSVLHRQNAAIDGGRAGVGVAGVKSDGAVAVHGDRTAAQNGVVHDVSRVAAVKDQAGIVGNRAVAQRSRLAAGGTILIAHLQHAAGNHSRAAIRVVVFQDQRAAVGLEQRAGSDGVAGEIVRLRGIDRHAGRRNSRRDIDDGIIGPGVIEQHEIANVEVLAGARLDPIGGGFNIPRIRDAVAPPSQVDRVVGDNQLNGIDGGVVGQDKAGRESDVRQTAGEGAVLDQGVRPNGDAQDVDDHGG